MLSLQRAASLIVGTVLLISGLGTTTFWAMSLSGREIFVPFGLSTFRTLRWFAPDAVLAAACLSTAALHFAEHRESSRAALATGVLFVLMGILGFALVPADSPEHPALLNVWFLAWGGLCVWLGGFGGVARIEKLDTQLRAQYAPISASGISASIAPDEA